MAAFCACCGAEITRKVEACPVCGTPRHGMFPLELEQHKDADKDPAQGNAEKARGSHDS
jgi:hypothetical protein